MAVKKKRAQTGTRTWWRRMRDTRGVAALEFALVGPILILLIMGVIETGLVYYAQFVLKNAVSNTARILRTNQDTSLDSVTALRNYICTTGGASTILSKCTSNLYIIGASFNSSLTSYAGTQFTKLVESSSLKNGSLYSQITNYTSSSTDSTSSSETTDSSTYSSMVTECNVVYLRVFYPWTVVTPGLNWFLVNYGNNTRVLSVTEVFRNEPTGTSECSNS